MKADPLLPWRSADLDLPALVTAVAALLSQCPAPQEADERVRALPDERTIRYYQTLGLVDRPSRFEGRIAKYGFRQLLQVCCIKLLQFQGMGLSAIQNALAGAADEILENAVREGLGMGARPPPAHRPLLALQLRPGITILIDPTLVANPESIFNTFLQALQGVSS